LEFSNASDYTGEEEDLIGSERRKIRYGVFESQDPEFEDEAKDLICKENG